MPCISLLENFNNRCCAKSEVCVPGPKIFLFVPACAGDAAAVNPNGTRTLLANCLSATCF